MRGPGPGPGCMLSTRAWASWARGGSAESSSASARRSTQRGLETVQAAVAAKAGHEAAAVADISFLGSWAEMEPQAWHLDGEPRLAFIVALHDMAATDFICHPKA